MWVLFLGNWSDVCLFQRQGCLKGFRASPDCQGHLIPDAIVIQNPQQVRFALNLFPKWRHKKHEQGSKDYPDLLNAYTKTTTLMKMELTGLPSTATMISPRTILPAKPLPVGARPALAAALPRGTYGGTADRKKWGCKCRQTSTASCLDNKIEGYQWFSLP